jgi:hypothetical protein
MEKSRPTDEPDVSSRAVMEQLAGYPLLEALIERRSRRFGYGMRLNGGPLSYRSVRTPQPLSLEEEAALAFAGCGITGPWWPNCPTTAAISTRPAEATS